MKKLLLIFAAMAFLAVGCTPDFERYWESDLNAELPEIGDGDVNDDVNDDEDGNGNEGGEGGAYDYFTGKQWIWPDASEAMLFDFGLTLPGYLIAAEPSNGGYSMYSCGTYQVEEISDTEGYIICYVEVDGETVAELYYYEIISETKFAIIEEYSGEYYAFYFDHVDDPYNINVNGASKPEAKAERNLVFSATSVEATLGEAFTAPTLSGEKTGVVYSSSNTGVATVNSTTGAVTLVAAGVTTITATAPETETLQAGTASYTLTVLEAATEPDEPVVKTLTNAEILNALTSSETSYFTYDIQSASGVWNVNASQLKTNTFLQCRGKKGSYIKTPAFDKDIKSVTIHFTTAKQVYKNNVYCVFPATWTAPTADEAYPETGNVGKATTDGSYSLTIPVAAGNKQVYVSIIGTYSYYLDHIDVEL